MGATWLSTEVEWLVMHIVLDKTLKVHIKLNANNVKFAPAYAKIA